MLSTFFILLCLLLAGCENQTDIKSEQSFTVVSWNVQSLFDSVDNGNEYAAFRQKQGWSRARYNERISSLAEVLRNYDFSSADVIFFQEVENSTVLKDLLSAGLRRRGFIYYGVIDNITPISVGFISKIKPFDIIIHFADSQRPIMQTRFLLNGESISVFNLHAKSNLGEESENLRLRKEYARYLNKLVASSYDEKIILLGDFNTSIRLDTLDMLSSAAAINSSEIITRHSLPVASSMDNLDYSVFYDPLLDSAMPFPGEGTYYYNGIWTLPDHILLSSSLVEFCSLLEITILSDYTSDSEGKPDGYDTSIWRGYSDHFPLRLTLTFPGAAYGRT